MARPLWAARQRLQPRWRSFGSVPNRHGRLVFPLNEDGPVAVQIGSSPRAEPLSVSPSPHWDRLVSSGRLDDITPDEAVGLTREKWREPLLGLAGGYACFAQRSDDYVRIVLRNLRRLDPELPDLTLLTAALDRRSGVRHRTVRAQLEELAATGALPIFRWGFALGILAARHYNVSPLVDRLTAIEPTLATNSIWTLWSG